MITALESNVHGDIVCGVGGEIGETEFGIFNPSRVIGPIVRTGFGNGW